MPAQVNALAQVIMTSLLNPQAVAAAANQSGVDTLGWEGLINATLTSGTLAGTSPTVDARIEHTDAVGSGYTAVTSFAQVTVAGSLQTLMFQREQLKRYIRFAATAVGGSSTPSIVLSCLAGYQKKVRP